MSHPELALLPGQSYRCRWSTYAGALANNCSVKWSVYLKYNHRGKKNTSGSIYSPRRQRVMSRLQIYEPFGGEISVFPSISSIGSSLPLTVIYGGNVSVSTAL